MVVVARESGQGAASDKLPDRLLVWQKGQECTKLCTEHEKSYFGIYICVCEN